MIEVEELKDIVAPGYGARGTGPAAVARSVRRVLGRVAQLPGDHADREVTRIALAGEQGIEAAGETTTVGAVPLGSQLFAVSV